MCKCKRVDGKSHYMKEERHVRDNGPDGDGSTYSTYRLLQYSMYLPRNRTTLKLTITHRNFPISDSHGNQAGPWMIVSPMNEKGKGEKKKSFPEPNHWVCDLGRDSYFFRYINLSPAAIGSAKGVLYM